MIFKLYPPISLITYWGFKSYTDSIPIRCSRLRSHHRGRIYTSCWMHQASWRDSREPPEEHTCPFKNAKANLRNSWWETAVKMERFFDSESKNRLTQRGKSSDFAWCVSCAPFSRLFPAWNFLGPCPHFWKDRYVLLEAHGYPFMKRPRPSTRLKLVN